MLKHYFRRRNPVLYGEDNKTKPISADAAEEKSAEAEPEYSLLFTAYNNAELAVAESILRSNRIPYVLREKENESWRRAFFGTNTLGTEIYVPETDLDAAAALVTGKSADEGDLAEQGRIPDVVADAGGWTEFNRLHGLDPDNRELPGDKAELGLIPEEVANAGGWALYNAAHGLDEANRALAAEPEGDLAELGRIPDVVADAGGWLEYNRIHGLDPDNRELPGDKAELGL